MIGAKITTWVRRTLNISNPQEKHPEREPLLAHQKTVGDEEAVAAPIGTLESVIAVESPKLRDVLSYQTTLNLVVYTLLALYTLAYDQVCVYHHLHALDHVRLP